MAPSNKADSPTASSEGNHESSLPLVKDANAPRPQHKITREERAYLVTRLPEYRALQATLAVKGEGPRGVRNVKGNKKDWVRAHVFEDFKKMFNLAAPGGPALDSVFKEIYTWFNNNRDKNIGPSQRHTISLSKTAPKRPRAKNAEDIFADEQKTRIVNAMSQKRAQGGATTEQNLAEYNRLKKQYFLALPESERNAYEAKASNQKAQLQGKPDSSQIFENQKTLVQTTIHTLQELIGDGWGQHGDAVFFVMGGYRDENEKVVTFNVSVGGNLSQNKNNSFGFVNDYPGNYSEDLRRPFKQWAAKILCQDKDKVDAAKQATPSFTILYRTDGFPLLPAIDFDTISPVNCRSLLTDYIQGVWEFTLSEESLDPTPPLPWEALHRAEHRLTLLMDPDAFSQFKSLDPARMSVSEIYDVLNHLSNAQSDDHYLLEFNTNDDVVLSLISQYSVDQDIVEVPDPSTIAKKKTKKKRGTKKAVLSDEDVPDFSPPSRTNPNYPPEANRALSPVGNGELGLLPNHIIVSALQAVAAHYTATEYEPDALLRNSVEAAPSPGPRTTSSPPQSGHKRSRAESDESIFIGGETDQVEKRPRLEEPSHVATKVTAPKTDKKKATKQTTGAKRSKKAPGNSGPAAHKAKNVPAAQKAKRLSTTKAPKKLLPPPLRARASKRIGSKDYKNTAVTIPRED